MICAVQLAAGAREDSGGWAGAVGGGVVAGSGDAGEDCGAGAGVGDLQGEYGVCADEDGAEVERGLAEGERGGGGGSDEGDEFEWELESVEISIALARTPGSASCGVKVTVRVQLAPGTRVVQLVETVKSGVVCRPRTWKDAVPVLLRVTVWGAEMLPAMVEAKVRELWEGTKATSGAVFEGEASAMGVEVPVRSTRSGLEAASLSMMRKPVSVSMGGEDVPVTTWLSGVYVSATAQVAAGARVAPQVVVARNGHCAGEAADGERERGGGVGQGEGLLSGLARWHLAEAEDVAGEKASGDGERAGASAVAFEVGEAVEGGGAVGGDGLGEEGAGDVSVGEGQEGDGEVATAEGREGEAGCAREDELAGQSDAQSEGF